MKPRNPKLVRNVVLAVVAGLVVCCGLGVGGFALLFRFGDESPGAAREATVSFLNSLEERDFPHAYEQLCQRTKGQYSQARFATVAAERRIRSYEITDASVERVNGKLSGSVRTDITYVEGVPETRTILLVKEGDNWRVCGQPY